LQKQSFGVVILEACWLIILHYYRTALALNFNVISIILSDNQRGMVFPSTKYAYVGDTVVFECRADSHVAWSYNRIDSLPSNAILMGEHHETLVIKNVTLTNSGQYLCLGITSSTNGKFEGVGVLIIQSKSISAQ